MKQCRFRAAVLLYLFILYIDHPSIAADRDFALHLYRSGQYASAISEFERVIFYSPDDPFSPYAQYLIALSYAKTDRYREALDRLNGLIEDLGNIAQYESLFCECWLQILNIHFRQKEFHDFVIQAERMLVECPRLNAQFDEYFQNMITAAHIYNREWDEALSLIEASRSIDERVRVKLEEGIEEVVYHRSRSPVLGGVFALIPGLGHIYAGRMMDGVRSFLINAALIALTIFAFIIGVPSIGLVFGIVEAALFISNVYGGINAVMQENARFTIGKRDAMLKWLVIPPLDVISVGEDLEIE